MKESSEKRNNSEMAFPAGRIGKSSLGHRVKTTNAPLLEFETNMKLRLSIRGRILLPLLLLTPVSHLFAAIIIGGPTSDWTAIPIGAQNDFFDDQKTGGAAGAESDIVGNATSPGFFSQFDNAGTASKTDGTFALRVRLGADRNPTTDFDQVFFAGFDVNGDGALDFFMGVESQVGNEDIVIWAPDAGAQNSPATTQLGADLFRATEVAATYNWAPVDNANDPGVPNTDIDSDGENDYFLSFSVPFAEIVAAASGTNPTFDEDSPIRYVIGSSTQANSFNQDIGGINGGTSSTLTFSSLGAVSGQYSANGASLGALVPEPTSLTLFATVGTLLCFRRRSRQA